MIQKSGKLYLNGKLQKNRFSKDSDYGFITPRLIEYNEIVFEYEILGFKLAISRKRKLVPGQFIGISFDPDCDRACDKLEVK